MPKDNDTSRGGCHGRISWGECGAKDKGVGVDIALLVFEIGASDSSFPLMESECYSRLMMELGSKLFAPGVYTKVVGS